MNNLKRKIVAVISVLVIFAMITPVNTTQAAISDECRANIEKCTTAELVEYITELKNTLQVLQDKLGEGTTPPTGVSEVCKDITFTRNLKVGISGADVKCLQALLNVAPQTGYFGSLTKNAVIAYQQKEGISPAVGFVGPLTRAKLNVLVTQPTPPTPPTEPTPPAPPTDGTEGSITAKLTATPVNVKVKRGESNKAVMAFEIKAKNSDMVVKRIDLNYLDGRPWKLINHIALYDGENAIKGIEPIKANIEEITTGTNYNIRFTDLDIKVAKDTAKTITVKVSVPSLTEDTGSPVRKIRVNANAIRAVDTLGLNQYGPSASFERSFTVEAATTGVLSTKVNAGTPKEGAAIVSATADTTEIELAKFDVKVENLAGTITEVKAKVNSDLGANITKIAAVKLYDGTTLLSEKSAPSASGGIVTFDELKVAVAKDATKVLTVKANVSKDIKDVDEGKYIEIVLDEVKGEDANENAISDINDRTAKKIYTYTKAPIIVLDSTSISKSQDNKTAEFSIKFKVTAKGGDIFVVKTATANSSAQAGRITAWTDPAVPTGTPAVSVSFKDATEENTNSWKISEDATATITVNVFVSDANVPTDAAAYKALIKGIAWGVSDATANTDNVFLAFETVDLVTATTFIVP